MKSDDKTERAAGEEGALREIRQREENEIEAKIEELRKHKPSSLRDKDDKENRLKKLKKELDEIRCKPLHYFLEPSRKRRIEKIRKILHQVPDSPGRGPEDTDRPLEEYSDQELVRLEIMIKLFRLDDGKGAVNRWVAAKKSNIQLMWERIATKAEAILKGQHDITGEDLGATLAIKENFDGKEPASPEWIVKKLREMGIRTKRGRRKRG